jgi:GTP-binding protein Era
MAQRSGFVNIIGRPNAGKSTLMNALVGEPMAIISHKAQTTRHRIIGIVNEKDLQIVFSDTPGIIDPKYKLQKSMMRSVSSAMKDADVLIWLTTIGTDPEEEHDLIRKVKDHKAPLMVLINKIDLSDQEKIENDVTVWRKVLPNALVAPISALHDFNVKMVYDKIVELIPEHPQYFEEGELTDRPLRFFISEMIREKILKNYHQEIPYSCEVIVNEYKEEEDIIRIKADVIVARETQKGIIIGHQGKMLKRTGTQSRIDLEKYLQKKIFLEIFVRVDKNWRDKDDSLKKFGYN